jgi:membrane fusion protein (multidrug efflux system)
MPARSVFLAMAIVWAATAQSALVAVISKPVSRTVELPGEIHPFLEVALHAKVPGFVERVTVDRGSFVRTGDLLVELSAPEMTSRIQEEESKQQAAEADRLQAEAALSAAQANYDHLKKASETPGAIAGLELVQAEKQVEAARASLRSREEAAHVAQAVVQSQKDLLQYLKVSAPFDGIVTDRLVHPGALVGTGPEALLLVVQQVARLRLVVPVPEEDVGAMTPGASVPFHVPAFPERIYTGVIARSAHSLDPKTRTMPVELDVMNRDGSLAPGMYPSVKWPVHTSRPALWVPRTSVVSTTERTFVIRARDGKAEWVDVKKGAADGDLVEVMGDLRAGDLVVRRGTDEIRPGAAVTNGK